MPSVPPSGLVTLLTDFGLDDHYVGVMKGVILRIFPRAQIIDVTHRVKPYSVQQGAFYLDQSHRYFPEGSVHVGVVDPGVGGPRRPLAAAIGSHYFIAPDNGLLSRVLEREPEAEIREIDADQWGLKPLSRTFHGRDLFSPAAARLASGVKLEELGKRVEDPVRLWPAEPREDAAGRCRGGVLNIDRFGNIVTSFKPEHVRGKQFRMRVGTVSATRLAESFVDAGDTGPVLIIGSSGFLEVAIRQGSAADKAGAAIGDEVELVFDDQG